MARQSDVRADGLGPIAGDAMDNLKQQVTHRVLAVKSVPSLLPDRTALQAVRNGDVNLAYTVGDDQWRAYALAHLAVKLDSLELAQAIEDPEWRTYAIADLAVQRQDRDLLATVEDSFAKGHAEATLTILEAAHTGLQRIAA